MFKGKHTEETKKKISASRRKYKGANHPRSGAEWTEEQRVKFQLTMYNRQRAEQILKAFLMKHNSLWESFQKTTNL